MPTARVNNCNIYYEDEGEGPCIVFIHGESHGIELFEYQLPDFARRFRCVAYYRRGHGKSECPPYGYSVWNQTQDLIGLLDHLKIEHAAIVAVAMSTTVAATYAMLHPERVRSLVLASWYELDGYPVLEQRRKRHAVSFADLHIQMGEMLEAEGREALARYLDENYERVLPILPHDASVRAKIAKMFATHPRAHYVQSADFYTSISSLIESMDRIKCPILGICGDDDPSPDRPERLAHLPNFRQAWIKGARRFSMMEQPEAFNREFLAFLDEPNDKAAQLRC
jgi:3-oxoadipate enol-lactonase